ncbi:hypothetical protein SLE2022_028960 [Rubroshorea leprosula]
MAGWTEVADGGDLGCVEHNESLADIEPLSTGSGLEVEFGQLRCTFDEILGSFLEEVCARDCFWSFPPMLGNGQSVNLFKLFLAVRERGGYNVVSENGLWDSVAEECGLGLIGASSIKLVYVKYLEAFERLLEILVESKGLKGKQSDTDLELSSDLMGLSKDLEGFLSELDKKNVGNPQLEASLLSNSDSSKKSVSGGEVVSTKRVLDFGEVGKLQNEDDKVMVDVKNVVVEDCGEGKSCAISDNEKKPCSHKRKRDSILGMLNWVTKVAENPCDPIVGSLPERSKWNSHRRDEFWKQVLLFREATFTTRRGASSAQQSHWQKTQKMHPCMYDDQTGSAYDLRERLSSTKKKPASKTHACSSKQTDLEDDNRVDGTGDPTSAGSVFDYDIDYQIPIGPDFQAELPEWTGSDYKSEPKWLGSRIWPLAIKDPNVLIERDPIGRGRRESCGCQFPGSIQCVKFHIAEKRYRVKLELASAFRDWKFHRMGEEVAFSWNTGDQKLFDSILKNNSLSLDRCFWDQTYKRLPNKSREDLVSYYFNVFMLQKRAYQNRYTPNKIDSDDDESEHPILLTPKKVRKKSK